MKFRDGTITKVLDFDKNSSFDLICESFTLSSKFVAKHSKNIIDLIEIDDYVNGHKVKALYFGGTTKYIKLENAYIEKSGVRIYENDIKSIVTKEQFASMEYKVKE